jgi:hypothetical protein
MPPLPALAQALRGLPAEFWTSQHTLCPPSHAVRLRATSKLIRGLLDALAALIPTAVTVAATPQPQALLRGLRQVQTWAGLVAVSLHGALPEDAIVDCLRALDGVTSLELLSLQGHRLQREGTVQAIAACVARQNRLARLDLSDTALGEHLQALCKLLCKNNRVKSVCLANSKLDIGSVWSVAVFTRATELDLSRNALFNTEFWIKLRFYSLLPQLRSLRRLVLDDTRLKDADAMYLYDLFTDAAKCKDLEVLSLQNNALGGTSCRKLAALLTARPQLQCVDLRGNELRAYGYDLVRQFINDGTVRCSYSGLRLLEQGGGKKCIVLCEHGVRLGVALEMVCRASGMKRDGVVFMRGGRKVTGQEVVGEATQEGAGDVFLGYGDVEIQCLPIASA